MIHALRVVAIAAALLSLNGPCSATDVSSIEAAKRTTLGLYLTSEEVPPFLAEKRGHSLFVDVRTPAELASTGVATLVDANVPSLSLAGADPTLQPNPDFVAGVESRMVAKGLGMDDVVVLICRTGKRSSQAANRLAAAGFSHVYTVVDGFMGDGEGGGEASSGWRNKGLAWRYP